MMNPLILASASPRRQTILSFFSVPFITAEHYADERSIPWDNNPEHYVSQLAAIKAKDVATRYPNHPIISADTIVVLDDLVFNKPQNQQECRQMLLQLSGRRHEVYTAVGLHHNKQLHVRHEITSVEFHDLSEQQLDSYLITDIWKDKAGGYAVQGPSALFIKRIDGCFYNVQGLPIHTLNRLLQIAGIDLWQHMSCSP